MAKKTPPIIATPDSILARLRDQTRTEHDAIEAALGLMAASLTLDTYRRTLERFYGYYRPVEEAVHAAGGWDSRGLDLGEWRKTPLLEADLLVLGVDTPQRLPLCLQLPSIVSAAGAFGALYVMEGATLGGQFISRHTRQTLGVTPEAGGRFFYGYGDRTGEMWQTFRAALVAFAATEEIQNGVVEAAVETFRTLREWCQGGRS